MPQGRRLLLIAAAYIAVAHGDTLRTANTYGANAEELGAGSEAERTRKPIPTADVVQTADLSYDVGKSHYPKVMKAVDDVFEAGCNKTNICKKEDVYAVLKDSGEKAAQLKANVARIIAKLGAAMREYNGDVPKARDILYVFLLFAVFPISYCLLKVALFFVRDMFCCAFCRGCCRTKAAPEQARPGVCMRPGCNSRTPTGTSHCSRVCAGRMLGVALIQKTA